MNPDEMSGTNTVLKDAMINQSNTKLLNTTKRTSNGELPDKTNTKDGGTLPTETDGAKPATGMFKTKTITICRAKDLQTCKCMGSEHLLYVN